jgi:outer membrane protein
LLQATNQRRNATFALGRLVGAEGAVAAQPTQTLEPSPLALDRAELADMIIGGAPTVRAAAASASAADAAVRAARAQYLPSISASGGYDWLNQQATFNDGSQSWAVRVGVSYPIFNRFQREDNVGRAGVQSSVARAQLQDARRAARVELERVLAALELAEQQIALTEEAVAVAEEDLRVQRERYRLGVSTILDQVASQANLVQAETDRIAARYDYHIARAELEALAGREL